MSLVGGIYADQTGLFKRPRRFASHENLTGICRWAFPTHKNELNKTLSKFLNKNVEKVQKEVQKNLSKQPKMKFYYY